MLFGPIGSQEQACSVISRNPFLDLELVLFRGLAQLIRFVTIKSEAKQGLGREMLH